MGKILRFMGTIYISKTFLINISCGVTIHNLNNGVFSAIEAQG